MGPRMSTGTSTRKCSACGDYVEDGYVTLAWRQAGIVERRYYCASWISALCFEQYEHAADQLGY